MCVCVCVCVRVCLCVRIDEVIEWKRGIFCKTKIFFRIFSHKCKLYVMPAISSQTFFVQAFKIVVDS